MAQELEIKLTLTPRAMVTALAWLSAQPQATLGANKLLINTYYDTPKADLNRQKAALRVRQKGDACIQTVKTQGRFVSGMHQREEWEWPLAEATLNLALLAATPLGEGIDLAQLAPVFETNFTRQIVMIEDGEAVIECALDKGAIVTGKKQRPLCEVEFELKSGNPQRLLVWAERLAQQCPVFVNLISKAEQGYYLAGLYTPTAPTKATNSQADAVTALFQRLGIAWLTESAVSLAALDMSELTTVAQNRAVTDQWAHITDQLHNGATLDEVMAQPALGQLQLALLM